MTIPMNERTSWWRCSNGVTRQCINRVWCSAYRPRFRPSAKNVRRVITLIRQTLMFMPCLVYFRTNIFTSAPVTSSLPTTQNTQSTRQTPALVPRLLPRHAGAIRHFDVCARIPYSALTKRALARTITEEHERRIRSSPQLQDNLSMGHTTRTSHNISLPQPC